MKQFIKTICLTVSAICICGLPSCEKEELYLSLNPNELRFSYLGGSSTFMIDTNSAWSISAVGENQDLISFYPESGRNSATVTVSLPSNYEISSKTYTLDIIGPDRRVFYVRQEGNPYAGNGGNNGGYDDNTGNGGNTGGNDNTGGYEDNTGGGNSNTGNGGNTGGSTTQQKPTAPTGVYASNEGSAAAPYVVIRWNSVSGADKYYVYKSSSANGSYSKLGEITYAAYADTNPPVNGASAYYKVKAVNSAGESDYSNYAQYTSESNDTAYAPAYVYGNCSVSGSTITLRWTNSTGNGYGKATDVVLRVWNPYAEEWQDTKLSATATYASFDYTTKVDGYGYVKAGIVVSNAKGSFTAGAKIYDTKNKKWLN